MKFSSRLFLVLSITVIALVASVASASAATKIGSECVANNSSAGTLVQTGVAAGGPTYTVPAGGGIITSWGSNVIPYPGGITAKLQLVTPAGAGVYNVIRSSSANPIVSGTNSFPTRLTVSGGEQIVMYSALGALACSGSVAGDTTAPATVATETPDGGSFTAGANQTTRYLALYASIEADVDKDGFGDETQDLCPQSAKFQIACPLIAFKKFVIPGAKSTRVIFTTNFQSKVTLAGTVKLPKIGKSKAKTVKLKSVSKGIVPTDLGNFTIKYGSSVLNAQKALPKSKKLTVNLTLTGEGVLANTVQKIKVTLRGTK